MNFPQIRHISACASVSFAREKKKNRQGTVINLREKIASVRTTHEALWTGGSFVWSQKTALIAFA